MGFENFDIWWSGLQGAAESLGWNLSSLYMEDGYIKADFFHPETENSQTKHSI